MASVGNMHVWLSNALDMNKCDAPVSNKIQCSKGVEWKRTHHFFHIDVVHISLLEWIGLGRFIRLILWAVCGIVSLLLAIEACDMREILLSF
jgi:hypothetical protein